MAWAPDYVEVSELTDYVSSGAIDPGDDFDDVEAARAIAAASRAVDREASGRHRPGRQFGLVAAPEVRHYTPWWSQSRCRWVVDVDDLMTAVGLVVVVDGVTVTGSVLLPLNAAQEGRPWTQLVLPAGIRCTGDEGAAAVTARWGWTSVPTAVTTATLLQASRFLSRRTAPFGIAGSPESGSEMRLLARVDPDVAVALADYRRRGRLVTA